MSDEVIVKRKRGRPRKNPLPEQAQEQVQNQLEQTQEQPVEKRKRGRPRKNPLPESTPQTPESVQPEQAQPQPEKRKRGRPRKNPLPEPSPAQEPLVKPAKKIELKRDYGVERILSQTVGKQIYVVKFENRWYHTHDLDGGFVGGFDNTTQILGKFLKMIGILIFKQELDLGSMDSQGTTKDFW